jgi:hypothetical protein
MGLGGSFIQDTTGSFISTELTLMNYNPKSPHHPPFDPEAIQCSVD